MVLHVILKYCIFPAAPSPSGMLGCGRANVSEICDLARANISDGLPSAALEAFSSLGASGVHDANQERDLHRWLHSLYGLNLSSYKVTMNLNASSFKQMFSFFVGVDIGFIFSWLVLCLFLLWFCSVEFFCDLGLVSLFVGLYECWTHWWFVIFLHLTPCCAQFRFSARRSPLSRRFQSCFPMRYLMHCRGPVRTNGVYQWLVSGLPLALQLFGSIANHWMNGKITLLSKIMHPWDVP